MSYTSFKKISSVLFIGVLLIMGLGASSAQALIDSTSPVVATVTPLTATAGQSVTVNSSFTEEGSGINYCYLIVNGVGLSGDMTRSGSAYAGTLSQAYTFATAGSYTAAVRCYDMSGNIGQSTDATVVVSAAVPSDVTPPAVTMSTVVSSIGVGTPITFSANYSDASDVPSCRFVLNGEVQATMSGTGVSGSVSYTRTFSSSGVYSYYFSCTDASGNVGFSATRSLSVTAPSVDSVAPVLGALSPAAAVVGAPVTFTTTYADSVGVVACELDPGTATTYPATLSGPMTAGTASRAYTFTSPGVRTVYMRCSDASGNVGTAIQSVNVVSSVVTDVTAPVVGPVSPTSIATGQSIVLAANYTDTVGVVSCRLYVNGGLVWSSGTLLAPVTSGQAQLVYSFPSAGTYAARYECQDAAGNNGVGTNTTLSVTATGASSDTTPPAFVGSITPTNVSVNMANTYSVGYTDNVGVTRCDVYADYVLAGYAQLSGTTSGSASWSQTFNSVGTHVMRFDCQDAAGNRSGTANVPVYVSAGGSSFDPVSVGQVSPASVAVGVNTNMTAWVSNTGYNIATCDLYVNGSNAGGMIISGTYASRYYTFSYPGTYSVYARCYDRSGNGINGQAVSIQTSGQITNPGQTPGAATMGNLMKAACPGYYVAADHPCHAVYYFGRDGRRHAFPNANVYFTWYSDFSRVVEVSDSFLASVPLGRNVTYRPGIRMVKFTTLNRVYTVSRGGILRWVTTEDLARQLYGYNWATQVDDIADVFYTNYTFGSDIYTGGQFSPAGEAALAPTIDDNF